MKKRDYADQLLSFLSGSKQDDSLHKYQNDPVGYCKHELCVEVTDEVRIMMESVRDNVVTIARSCNASGKSHGGAHIADWWYNCFPDSQCFTTASPSSNLEILWAEIDKIRRNRPENSNDIVKTGEIRTTKSHFIKAITVPTTGSPAEREGKFSGKHAPYLLFILDEGDTLPDYVYRGIESCMSGGILIRLLILFNPRSKRGIPYRMEENGEGHVVVLTAFNHPNVRSGDNLIPGAVTREVTVVRINTWSRPVADGEKVDEECYKLPDFLVGCTAELKNGQMSKPLVPGWYKVTDSQMFYMVLGRYPTADSSQLIPEKYIRRARERWDEYVSKHGEIKPKREDTIMGLDVAELGSDVSSVCLRTGNFVERFRGWSKVEIPGTITKAIDIYNSEDVTVCNVDGNGVGAGVGPAMALKGCRAYNIKSQSKPTTTCELGDFKIVRSQDLWRLRNWLIEEEAMLPPAKKLLEEITALRYGVIDGYVWITKKDELRKELGRSPDDLDALALTFHPDNRMFSWV